MSTEPITGLTYQAAGSQQTDALQNAELNYYGAWLNCVVLSVGDATPPGSPANGDRYIVGASATGAWAMHDDELAIYRDGWQFYAPPAAGVPIVKNLDDGADWECVAGVWSAKAGGTALGHFDVTTYGATGDGTTDDTVAIQDAIDAAEAAGGGVVYFPAGVYVVNGALQDTGRSNAQLLLPLLDAMDTEQMTIEFRGEFAPPCDFSVIGATPLPVNHSIIKGTLNSGTGSLLGAWGPVGTAGTFTNVHFVGRNLTFRMPANPALAALNLASVACVDLDNIVVDCGSYYIQGLTEPTTTTSYGIRMPANNNGALSRLGTVNVLGFYNGYEFAEHCNGFATQGAWGCKLAFVFTTATNHASYFARLMAHHCEKVIVATGITYVNIAQLNVEHAASGWWVTDYDIDDASHYLSGSVTWHVVLAGTGVDSTFTVNGGAKLNMTRIGFHNRVEQVIVSAAITFEGKHANKHIYHPSADTTARTWTIPANASVPYPIGTTLTFVNDNAAGALTIAITSDTMRLAGAGTTGSRTLAANGVATAVKMTSTSWQINGSGLT